MTQLATLANLSDRFHRDVLAAARGAESHPIRVTRLGAQYAFQRQRTGQIETLAEAVAPSAEIACWLLSGKLRQRFSLGDAPRQPYCGTPYIFGTLGRLPGTLEVAMTGRSFRLRLEGANKPIPHACALFFLEEIVFERSQLVTCTWAPTRQVAMWIMSDNLLDYLDK